MDTFAQAILNGRKKDDAQPAIRALENLVNNFSFSSKKTFESLEEQEKDAVRTFAFYIVRYIGETEIMTDGRNELAVQRGKEIASTARFQDLYNHLMSDDDITEKAGYDDKVINFYRAAVQKFFVEVHRTNQQSALGYMYYVLGAMDDELNEELSDSYGDTYYRLPMI